MKYIDIHCHLDSEDFDNDREKVLVRMKEKEVGAITIGADLESSKKAIEIAEANENIWACVGVHPESVFGFPSPDQGEGGVGFWEEKEFEKLLKNPKTVAIGECGLDYFRIESEEEKNKQKALFESQIQFAIKYNKPLMLHIRDAYNDALEILRSYPSVRGNVHFFAGDISVAKKFLDLDFTLSFTGVITFTHDYDEVIKYIPSNFIMSETDAPFVAPVPYRGKRNEPVFVIEVIKKMAEIKGENMDILAGIIINNAKRVFNI